MSFLLLLRLHLLLYFPLLVFFFLSFFTTSCSGLCSVEGLESGFGLLVVCSLVTLDSVVVVGSLTNEGVGERTLDGILGLLSGALGFGSLLVDVSGPVDLHENLCQDMVPVEFVVFLSSLPGAMNLKKESVGIVDFFF